ncbi:MAG: hypothetical protein JST25_12870 [Actinobacteria bacterium]|nr:hypothetical protein [Microbacterium sp.]MBS1699281.1 hypothetical protein [Actinomycetota bacterium]
MVAISRRALLQLAAVGSTAAFLTSNATAASGASTPPGLPSVETSSGAIDAYVSKTRFSGIATLLEIQEEYRRVVPIFPLVLPANWSFPDDPGLGAPDPKMLWERGNGVVAAYLIWQSAIVNEAYEGHKRGDSGQKDHFLNVLEAAYATDVRKAVILDDDNVFINGTKATQRTTASRSPLQAAREGDFAPMRSLFGLN